MAKTIVGVFDTAAEAQSVVRDLVAAGVTRDHVSVMASRDTQADAATTDAQGDTTADDALKGMGVGAALGGIGGLLVGLAVLPIPGLGPVIAAGPIAATLAGAGVGAVTGGAIGALTHVGVPEEHAHHYAEAVRRGGTLVTVNADEAVASRVTDIMNRHHAVDVSERAAQWRSTGWKGYDADAKAYSAAEATRERGLYGTRDVSQGQAANTRDLKDGQVAIPVIEEKLTVGKREVDAGAVRVSNRVVEEPVEQQVRLREEHVKVERRAVDRAAAPGEVTAFREGIMEFKETVEEAVVAKTARVVEEVVIGKEATERTQTVRDTLKHTEVKVEDVGARRTQDPATPPRSML